MTDVSTRRPAGGGGGGGGVLGGLNKVLNEKAPP